MSSRSIDTSATQQQAVGIAGQRVPTRIASIDIFRGLTMLVMIFVNDLASVKGLPWWTYHMPRDVNGMTYVDMVFPAFLFIVGMSIPIATTGRLKKDPSVQKLWLHVVLRSISLVVLGLILANAGKGSRALMGINSNAWAFIALIGAVLFWNVYGRSGRLRNLSRILKSVGLVLMIAMFVIFRRTTSDGHVAWIDTSYWEILGLIGWTYLATSILYIPTRRWRWAPFAWLALLLLLNVSVVARWITWPDALPFYIWPFGSGAFVLMSMAGVVTSNMFLSDRRSDRFWGKARPALGFAAIMFAAAWMLTPLGVSKIRATPTWCLYSAGASVIIFTVLYWIADVKRWTGWASFVKPAGANTLMTYLLPDLYYFAFASSFLTSYFHAGWPGVIRAVVFTAAMLALSAVLTRWRVKMQL